jgi:hypothetical protein
VTYVLNGILQDYDPVSDTASVICTGIGIIDTWLTGVKIDVPINRALMALGTQVTMFVPDPNKLCEAHIVALPNQPVPATTAAGAKQVTQTGRLSVFNSSTASVTFITPFSAAPQVSIQGDAFTSVTITSVSPTGFTASFSGGPFFQWITWQATGPQ